MNFDTILTKFGQDIGVGPMALDDRQSCYLRFNENSIALEHLPDSDLIFIYTSFNHVPTIENASFEQLLTCNHFCQGSGNSWFSYNQDTREIFLMTKLTAQQLEYDEFVLSLEAFLQSIDNAKVFLENLNQQQTGPLFKKMHLKNPFA